MNSLKKIIFVAYFVIMALALASCRGGSQSQSAPAANGSFVLGEEPLTFSWYQNYNWASAKPWADTSLVQKWLKENMKIDINFIDAGGAAVEKLAVMIVSGDFPDVIQMDRGQDANNLINLDKIIPLNEFTSKYTNYYNDFKDNGILDLLTSEDGKWYQIPNWAIAKGKPNGNKAWLLNKKIYEELGNPAIETYDDLYDYLKLVKAKYPQMIPYESGVNFTAETMIFGGMLEDNVPDYIQYFSYPKDGKLELIFKNPAYRETMLFINKLFREGLITQDAFTQTSDQVKEKWSNGMMAVATGEIGDANQGRPNMQEAGNDWIVVRPLHKSGLHAEKIMVQSYNMIGYNISLITKNAKNPEAIYAFFDYMYSTEGQALSNYGPKGMYYDDLDANGFPVLKKEYFAKPATEISKEVGVWQSIGNTSYVDACAMHIFEQTPPDKRDWLKIQQSEITWKTSKNVTEFANLIPSKNTDEGIIYQTLDEIYKEYRARMVFAKDSAEVNNLMDKLIIACEAEGANELIGHMQKIWDSNKQKLSKYR